MRWKEVTIKTTSEEIDLLCLTLGDLGIEGLTIEDSADFNNFLENNRQCWDYVDENLENSMKDKSQVKFYLSDDEDGDGQLKKICAALKIEPQVTIVNDSDWENNWKEFYKPIKIGEKLIIVPEWHADGNFDRIPLRLDPGLYFGTGSHATTRMCLKAMQNHDLTDCKVLDLGCGSGILGIGAKLLGAKHIAGCDIAPKAPDVALSNAQLNKISAEDFEIYAGNILTDTKLREKLAGGYDLVLANIVADVIIPLCETVSDFMTENAVFICSGIIEGRQAEIEYALKSNGFSITAHYSEEEWHCYEARK